MIIEKKGHYLLLVRPNGFGKSLFLSMMESYYDINMKECFLDLFRDLWIGKNPTSLTNQFQVMHLDFSQSIAYHEDPDELESRFNSTLGRQLDKFIKKYKSFYEKSVLREVLKTDSAADKMDILSLEANLHEYKLYLIVDEYDSFISSFLASEAPNTLDKFSWVVDFHCNFFKLIKGSFERIFMIGVTPLILNDLTNGYVIDWNISNHCKFNSILGFSEEEVRKMLRYYTGKGVVKDKIERLFSQMSSYCGGYCFASESYGRESVFNCELFLYYLNRLLKKGICSNNLLDKSHDTIVVDNYLSRFLRTLSTIDKGIRIQDRLSTLERICVKGFVDTDLKSSFPARDIIDRENFISLMYHLGILTIGGYEKGLYHLIFPNEYVRLQVGLLMKNIKTLHLGL